MAYSQTDLDRLDAAIASGTLKVRFSDGSEVTYRSMAELMAARNHVAAQLALASGACIDRNIYSSFERD